MKETEELAIKAVIDKAGAAGMDRGVTQWAIDMAVNMPVSALPSGPVTEMRWYRTRTCTGLLVVFRRSTDGAAESVTFTTQMGGRLRRLRVLPSFRV